MQAWTRRGLLAWALTPLALLFLLIGRLRTELYRQRVLPSTRLSTPVIVVGNVFVGGTGKTPFTIWLVDALRAMGHTPGVVSRGYGTRNAHPSIVDTAAKAGAVGDEPLLIARRTGCPVVVGRNRVDAAQTLLAAFPNVTIIVADDGLQHYALERDVEIVICDERGNGNGWVLPAGPLREPGSRKRDFTVVNAARLPASVPSPAFLMRLRATYAERLGVPGERADMQRLKTVHGSIAAAAGIGNPPRFFSMLKAAGLSLVDEIALPDHYDYALNPFSAVQADCILITEKDAVKCSQLEAIKNDPRIWVVPVSAQVDTALAHLIVEKCRGSPPA